MASMNVSTPDNLQEWIRSRIESGEYASESEYVRDLIRRDRLASGSKLSVEDVRRSIEESRTRDQTVPADDVFDRLEATLKRPSL